MSQGSRPDRVADQLRSELGLLLGREVHDPGIGFVTITRVQVSADERVSAVLDLKEYEKGRFLLFSTRRGMVSVWPEMRPDTTATAPNSPIARALQRMMP